MTQILTHKNITYDHLTGLPARSSLYNSIIAHPKGDLHVIFFSISRFPYPCLGIREGDDLLIKTAKLIAELLPEEASLYQWRDASFAVLLPFYPKSFVQKWQKKVLFKSNAIKLPNNLLEEFKLNSVIISSPPVSKKDLLKTAELKLQAIEQKITQFSSNPLPTYNAKAKEYTNFALANLWAKDPYFVYLNHAAAYYSQVLAEHLGLNETVQTNLVTAALWQDVAMNEIPLNILDSAMPLDEYDWQQIKKHPVIGADLLKYLKLDASICQAVRYHHENWNGTGYPEKLTREAIPLEARILRLTTCWAALQLPRPWRNAFNTREALITIKKAAGVHFDPELVNQFREIVTLLPAPKTLVVSET